MTPGPSSVTQFGKSGGGEERPWRSQLFVHLCERLGLAHQSRYTRVGTPKWACFTSVYTKVCLALVCTPLDTTSGPFTSCTSVDLAVLVCTLSVNSATSGPCLYTSSRHHIVYTVGLTSASGPASLAYTPVYRRSGPASLAACHSPQSEWGHQQQPKAFIPRPAEGEREVERRRSEKDRKGFQEELEAKTLVRPLI